MFASPGWRTTGTAAGHFLVTPPGWASSQSSGAGLRTHAEEFALPKDTQQIETPTPYVWMIGRTQTNGPADYAAVHKIQAGYAIAPLSQRGYTPSSAATPKIDPTVDLTTPPPVKVAAMTADKFFAYAAELLKLQPTHATDEPILAEIKKIGLEPGKSFNIAALDPQIAQGLQNAPADARTLMTAKAATIARIANGWSTNTDTMGVYGDFYLKRAIVAAIGLGANLPQDAVYPLDLFDKTALPPVDAFWSITLYGPAGNAYPNSINKQAVSSWMPFVRNADGSLDLYFHNADPGPALQASWLQAPRGAFNLTMRLYAPQRDVLIGNWNPPPVVNLGAGG